ncbi:uncharacterized protein LOC143301654 [Babylonia areolata]|uniref:uncharacterized protein LOC143301654 n=1 Tax=Babylonia areolata TaxID=304850 RepID=UPI003FD331DF
MTMPTTTAQQSPMQWCAAPTLPVFTGEPGETSAEDFVTEAERVLAAYPMGDEMAAYFIYSHLQGPARRELMLRDLEDTNTPEKVTGILLGVFGDGRRVTTLLSILFSRVQQPEESIMDYSHALRSMERTIQMKTTGALTADMLRDHFISGLRNTLLKRELRQVVRREPQTTFIQARDEALRLQRELEEDQQQQHAREQMARLGDKLLLLEGKVRSMQGLVSGLVGQRDEVLVKNRAVGKKKRKKVGKGKIQSAVGNRISPNHNKGKDFPKVKSKVSHNEIHRDFHNGLKGRDHKLQERISDKLMKSHSVSDCNGDDPCWDEWVLLPMPPDPGIPGQCWKKENGVDCQAAVKTPRPSRKSVCTGLCETSTRSHLKPEMHMSCGSKGARMSAQMDRNWDGRLTGSILPKCSAMYKTNANRLSVSRIAAVAC